MHTTNPLGAVGDGIAAAARARARLTMELIQFHPTADFLRQSLAPVSDFQAVRGEGGILRNKAGEAFMAGRHELADLRRAHRDARNHQELERTATRTYFWTFPR
ncbi:MAG: FAD-binding protein [Acutalibacteraceae bacterium]